MWGELFGQAAGAVSGDSGGGNTTKSGFESFSGGNFGAVNFGGSAGGLSINKETLMIVGAVAVALFIIAKKV